LNEWQAFKNSSQGAEVAVSDIDSNGQYEIMALGTLGF